MQSISIHKTLYMQYFIPHIKKSRIWETPTLSTDADSGTDTNLKRKGGRDDQWEALKWSCDHRANKRPNKKLNGKGTNKSISPRQQQHTDIATTRPTRPRGPSWWKTYLTSTKYPPKNTEVQTKKFTKTLYQTDTICPIVLYTFFSSWNTVEIKKISNFEDSNHNHTWHNCFL